MKQIGILIPLFILFNFQVFAQEKKNISVGKIIFEASVPGFEEIKAINETVTCILNTSTGKISSLVLIKDFHFKVALMEEHFNENYMESDTFPKATFKGAIQGFNINIIGTIPKDFKMKGVLNLHGKSKIITTIVKLKKVDDALEIISNFNINLEDFNIEIPKILLKKMSRTVNIKTTYLVK